MMSEVLLTIGGLLIGPLARLVLPGPDPMSILEAMAAGIAGSLIAYCLFDRTHSAGLLDRPPSRRRSAAATSTPRSAS